MNDTHGHAVGDQVLQATAKIMTQNMRAGDSAGALGRGRVSGTVAAHLAHRRAGSGRCIREAVEAFTLSVSDTNTQVRVTISFG